MLNVHLPQTGPQKPRLCIVLSLWMLVSPVCGAPVHAQALNVRLLYVGKENSPAYLGVQQGLNEAKLQGQFLGQTYSVETLAPEALARADLAPYAAVLADVEAGALRLLAGKAADSPVFNLRSDDDALRSDCIPNLLHVVPSARMKQDAVAQWRVRHPSAEVVASAWHPDFLKFAGRDLNKRFRAAFGVGMNESAWAGWASVKMSSDTIARQGLGEPPALLESLKTGLVFDGQKGLELDFRETGQLRQPLLLVEGGKIVGEAPVRGVAESDDALDSLGLVNCKND